MKTSSIDHLVVGPLGFERVRQAQAADHDVGARRGSGRAGLDVLPFDQRRAGGQQIQLGAGARGAGGACRPRPASCRARATGSARQRQFELRVGEEESAAVQLRAVARRARGCALAARADGIGEARASTPNSRAAAQPNGGAFGAEREVRRQPRAPRLRARARCRPGRAGASRKARARADRRHQPARRGGKNCHRTDPQFGEQAAELVFHHVGQRAHHQQLRSGAAERGISAPGRPGRRPRPA